MNKLMTVFLMLLASLSLKNLEAATKTQETSSTADAQSTDKKLNGKSLLEEDEKQIADLNRKLEEAKSGGADEATLSIINSYIKLAQEMKELNNKRHALSGAVKGFAEGVSIFSEQIKGIVAEVNKILATQADVAIKNAQVRKLLDQPQVTADALPDKK